MKGSEEQSYASEDTLLFLISSIGGASASAGRNPSWAHSQTQHQTAMAKISLCRMMQNRSGEPLAKKVALKNTYRNTI
jgi:hypothetical protein